MNDTQPAAPRAPEPIGLAVASLVLGIISIPFSLFLIGGVAGLVGIALGLIHALKRTAYKQMAIWGIALSAIGILFSVRVGIAYRRAVKRWEASAQVRWENWHGVRAPDFTVTTLDGTTIRLSDLRGKRVVLDFWATWCPPCVKEIPHYIELAKDSEAKDVVIVGISNEQGTKLKDFVAEHGITYPIASVRDDQLPAPFNAIQAIPTTFFIDRNGVIQTVFEGYRDYSAIREAALAGDYEGDVKDAPNTSPPSGETRPE